MTASPQDLLDQILHRPCIGAVAQHETGGSLLLHFGLWQLYEDPPNPRLQTTERGNWSLMIHCPWRLDSPKHFVCDWRSVSKASNDRVEAQLALEGSTVDSIQLTRPGLDLRLGFDTGYTLHTLCDSTGTSDDCWYLLLPDDSSVVATRSGNLIHHFVKPDS
jgi:hypothetical protein